MDTATRYAVASLVAGDKSARDAAAFVDHVTERLAGIGAELTGVLSDNGPEFTGKTFTDHLRVRGVRHHRIPPRSPNHNAVCEPFHCGHGGPPIITTLRVHLSPQPMLRKR